MYAELLNGDPLAKRQWHHVRVLSAVLILFIAVVGWSAAAAQQTQRTASDYGVSSAGQFDLRDANVQVWLSRLNDIELTLHNEEVSAEIQSRMLRDVNEISEGAKARVAEEEQRLGPIRRELASLGQAPAEGELSESEEIAALRDSVAERMAEVEFRLRELRLIVVRADNLALDLIARAGDPAFSRLWVRAPILFSWDTWTTAASGLATLWSEVVNSPIDWWTSKAGTTQPITFLAAMVAGLIAFFLGVPARRWLQHRLGRQDAESDPTYARRIGAAFVTAISDVLLPSLGLGTLALAIWLPYDGDTLLPSLAISVCLGAITFFMLTGLSRAFLAPNAPSWRLLPVTEEGAVALNRRVRILAIYIGLLEVMYRTAEHLGLLESLEFETTISIFTDALLVGLILTLLPSRYWHAEEEEEASPVAIGLSIALSIVLLGIPILDLIGFSVLASYLLWVLVITVVATGFTLLLRMAGQEALVQVLRPASSLRLRLYRWFRLGEGPAKLLSTLCALALDGFLFLTLAYSLLRLYGLPNELIVHWLTKVAEGLPIGNVVISPIDIVVGLLVFVAVLLATGVIRRWLGEKLRTGTRLDLGVRNAIVAGVGYGGAVLAIIIAIAVIGLDLSNLALVAGALSVGVGFGLRTVVENFVAGLLLLIERPIKEGDWIVAAGHHGTVKQISVRSTEIETFDRASVIVPNAELVAQPVENWTHKNRVVRVIVSVGVAYGSDTEKVREILLACAAENRHIHRYPEPEVLFQQFGESSLDFELRCFVKDTDYYLIAKSDLHFAVDAAFRDEGIEIPFPQRDVHVRDVSPMQVTSTNPSLTEAQPPSASQSKVFPFDRTQHDEKSD